MKKKFKKLKKGFHSFLSGTKNKAKVVWKIIHAEIKKVNGLHNLSKLTEDDLGTFFAELANEVVRQLPSTDSIFLENKGFNVSRSFIWIP